MQTAVSLLFKVNQFIKMHNNTSQNWKGSCLTSQMTFIHVKISVSVYFEGIFPYFQEVSSSSWRVLSLPSAGISQRNFGFLLSLLIIAFYAYYVTHQQQWI